MAGRDGNAETVSRQWVTAGIFDDGQRARVVWAHALELGEPSERVLVGVRGHDPKA